MHKRLNLILKRKQVLIHILMVDLIFYLAASLELCLYWLVLTAVQASEAQGMAQGPHIILSAIRLHRL